VVVGSEFVEWELWSVEETYIKVRLLSWFVFFQAGDGIRGTSVTGVQTCALPIYWDDCSRNKINRSDQS